MESLLTFSATGLARAMREREVGAREVVEAHIERIRQVNPRLQAMVAQRFDAARDEADAADRRLATEPAPGLPPLLGVPMTVKEAFALTGMPNSGGLVARRGLLAREDAVAVARLRAAGAIPLGVTNVSELCMWMECDNRVYGRTGNAHDPRRTSGGSSGGEGAIIAAGGSPFGLGSDIGGSIRMPAFFNGIFGHKPSGGLVPGTGQFPLARGAGLRYLTTGPLCRRAEDLAPLLRLLAGPDGRDEGCIPFSLGNPDEVDLRRLTVLDVRGNGVLSVSRELLQAQEQAARALEQQGATVRRIDFPGLRHSLGIWSALMSRAGGRSSFRQLMGRDSAGALGRQLLLWTVGASPHTLPAIVLGLIENLAGSPRQQERYLRLSEQLKAELGAALGSQGVMLYPSYPTCAPRHAVPLLHPFHWIYTAIVNVLELPATQVPLGRGEHGLPLGVQVVGPPGGDHLTIAVACALERACGGWVRPPQV